MELLLKAPQQLIKGSIILEGSKSISNRLLIMQKLCPEGFDIENLSPSDDTKTLQKLLSSNDEILDVGAAGTTMRFLTAYLAITDGSHILTGSERMKKRPIKILVDALLNLGADITYLGEDGFPPIKINGKKIQGGKINIRADVSSQYISALMMVGPLLEKGLELELVGNIGSFPYINMTLKTMEQLGIKNSFDQNTIIIQPGKYSSIHMKAESDWSAASYYFSMCALSSASQIIIHGLMEKSLQGDSVLPEIYKQLGVTSNFKNDILYLENTGEIVNELNFDFTDCPDLAQTVAVTCAAIGVNAKFTGVESLKIKETDRTQALSNELAKFGVDFYEEEGCWILKGETLANDLVKINTYEDHRMAMCFAPLAIKHQQIIIEDPMVVKKSYPSFWSDLESLGFSTSFT